ncbi:MAG: membrane protein insertase YidC [SAR86 cluster bacterium]|nr:membrane protein insertase YidC [SAR86 cluster bacterium]
MDYIKISLIGLIAVIVYYLALQWSGLPNEEIKLEVTENETITLNEEVFKDSKDSLSALDAAPPQVVESGESITAEVTPSRRFSLDNDVLRIEIDSLTGRYVAANLIPIKTEKGSDESLSIFGSRQIDTEDGCPVYLGAAQTNRGCVGNYFASSGFYSPGLGYLNPKFSSLEKMSLGDGGVIYILSGENEDLLFTRRVLMRPGLFSLEVEDIVGLKVGSEPTNVVPYARILRDGYRPPGRFLDFDSYTYLGPVFSTERDSFGKLDFSDLSENSFEEESLGGWLALAQRYFVSSWVPQQDERHKYQARKVSSGAYSIALTSQNRLLLDTEPASYKNTLYVGPKISDNLNPLHPDLGLVVDYGFLWWLSEPIHKLMAWGFSFLGNWGLAILFATIVLKAILWPLSAAGYRSAARMRAVAPEMSELQQKYANDKQKLGQEMMAFYKKKGVSPLGGCLPMLLQMPFFLAFYWVLLDMVELRHAPFMFWITDLSSYDPFFVLPILNAGLMYYSQKMMPVTPSNDPTQQQMQSAMKFMPLMIAAMFSIFPAGFVLYFTVQSLITVIQQALSFRKAGISLKSV